MSTPSANPTPITPPRVALIDQRTGLIDRAWYMYFLSLFNAAQTAVDGQNLGPDATSLAASLEAALQQTTQELQTQPVSVVEQIQPLLDAIAQRLDTLPRPELGTMAALQQSNVPWLTFDTTADVTPPDVGTVAWDGGTTLGVQMTPNVLLKVGEAEYIYAKASATITKGQVCYHTGAVGSSGVITVAPAPIGLTDPNQIVGIAAESIALNDFGLIQISGDVKGFDTTGSSVGEVWADGDPLYYNPAYVGRMTKNKPSAPNQKTYMGEVINAGPGGSGSMHVRIVQGSILGGTDSNVQFSALANGNLIQYDSALQYWKNVAPSSVAVTTFSAGTTGLTPSTPTSGAVTLAGTLGTANGGTGLVSFNNGGVLYASATNTLATSVNLHFDGTNVGIGTNVPVSKLDVRSGLITAGTDVVTSGSRILAGYYTAGNIATWGSEYASGSPVMGSGVWPSTTAAGSFVSSTGVTVQRGAYVITGSTHYWYSGALQTVAINGAVSIGEAMRLDSSGNLGVGLTPTYRIDALGSIRAIAAATQDAVILSGRAGGTNSYSVTLTPATLGASRTLTLPDNSGTVLTTGATVTVAQGGTGATTFTANGVLYGNTTSSVAATAAGTTGQVLVGNTGAPPSWSSATSVSVTSLSFGTTGLTPSTATQGAITVAGTLVAANGGTGQSSYTIGDILYASGTTALSKLADVATGNALISGGVGVAPSWGKIGLTTHVTGTLPVANGGTGLTSGTSGGVLFYSAAGTLASSGLLAANALMVGGGAGAAPSTVTTGTGVVTALGVNTGTAGSFVVNGGALGTPSSGTVTNLTGTASININGTVGATTPNTGAFTSVVSTSASGVLTRAAATQDGIALVGRAGGTGSWSVSLTPTTLSASRTATFPDSNTTIPIATQQLTFSGPTAARTYTLPDANATLLSTNAAVTVPQGGTGLTSGTSGGLPYFNATNTMASSGLLAANALVVGGGAGAAPSTITTGTGVTTALGINTGTAGAFVVNGGALGTPSSGTVTNLTGTASININGTVGATTPNTGAFTSVVSTSASGVLTRAAATQDGVELIGRAGGTTSLKVTLTPTTLTASRTLTLPDNSGTLLTTGATVTVAQGGTGLTSGTSGGVLYYSASGTLASSAALASNALVVGGGAGAAPATVTTGTGVVTALGVNTGSAGAFVVNGGALGTPSSGTVTNLTGTASININGTVGATTPNTGAFTTLTANDAVTFSATTQNLALGTSQTSGTWTAGGAAQTGTITLDQSTKAHTLNIGTGATENVTTKTINIGTAGVSGSTTNLTYGSSVAGSTTTHAWNSNGAEAMRLSAGRLLIGTNAAITGVSGQIEQVQLYGAGGAASSYAAYSISDTLSANVRQYRARAGTTALAAGDAIGVNGFVGYNGTAWANVSRIVGTVDVVSGGNLGGRLTLETATSGGTMTERVRINSSGYVGIGTASPSYLLDIPASGSPAARIGGILIGANGTEVTSATGELAVSATGANNMLFNTNSSERFRIDGNGNVRVGTAALATTATNGFLYVPTCAGVPTGTPTAITGLAPIVVDSTNNRLYFYSSGAWRNAGP